MMGGQLGVTSDIGQGSDFHFWVWLQPAAMPMPTVSRSERVDVSTHRARRPGVILLAEDNEINRRVATAILVEMGHHVIHAGTGREVLEVLGRQSVDLVLMDLQMPEMGGLEATRRWRAEESVDRRLPIVALTAHAAAEDRDRCLAAGMDAYLSKPLSEPELFAVLETFLECAGAGDPVSKPPATTNGALPTLVDSEKVLRQVRGDRAILAELIELFREQVHEFRHQFPGLSDRGDWEAIAGWGHKLSGSSGKFQAPVLLEALRRLERLAKSGEAGPVDECFAQVSPILDAVLTELDAMVPASRDVAS
jgi:CheY-like chemotaxis protein